MDRSGTARGLTQSAAAELAASGIRVNVVFPVSPELMDILGTAAALPIGSEDAADDGGAEYIFRLAGPVGIYGGTLEVFRNMIAQGPLGLGRPNYSAAK